MDIVKRLRKQKWQVLDEMRGLIEDTTAYEAADEIERLRKEIKRLEYYLPENIDFVRCSNGKDHFSFEIVYKALGEKE